MESLIRLFESLFGLLVEYFDTPRLAIELKLYHSFTLQSVRSRTNATGSLYRFIEAGTHPIQPL
jgi:hypothetical protein